MTEKKAATENDVFREVCEFSVSIYPHCQFVSVPKLARILKASKYQIRKHIKTLLDKGLIQLCYDGGQDEDGYPHCYKGYGVTKKAEETEIYKKAYQKETDEIIEMLKEYK